MAIPNLYSLSDATTIAVNQTETNLTRKNPQTIDIQAALRIDL